MPQEEEFIKEALLGKQSAFKALYEFYKASLFTICLRYHGSKMEAEDALQDGFVKIFQQLHQYDNSKGKFFSWACRVLINSILERKRKKKLKIEDLEISEVKEMVYDDSKILASLQVKEIIKAMQSMPEGYRMVFNLYFFEGYNHKEVADYLNVTESTSKTQLLKAKNFLRSKINDQMIISKA